MVIDIKMCRFDNVPWGFRLVGGSDFEYPLTVVKVSEGSIAEESGLQVGDVIVRVDDTATSPLTHDETNKLIKSCGNVFYFGIQRESEGEAEVNELKKFPVKEELSITPEPQGEFIKNPQCEVERELTKSPQPEVEVKESETNQEEIHDEESVKKECIHSLENRPCSALSENTEIKIVEEEIAAVLSGETEVLKEHNVLGIFPKPGVCMSSDVLRSLNEEAIKTKAEKDKENKKWSTFLQKPNRPIPKSKQQIEAERRAANAYRVKIVRSPISRERTPPPANFTSQSNLTPEQAIKPIPEEKKSTDVEEKVEDNSKEAEKIEEEPTPADNELPDLEAVNDNISNCNEASEHNLWNGLEKSDKEKEIPSNEQNQNETTSPSVSQDNEDLLEEKTTLGAEDESQTKDSCSNEMITIKVEKTEEELALERQLADVQKQLTALSSLPSTIQSTLDAVTKQLAELLPAFKLQQDQQFDKQTNPKVDKEPREINLEKINEISDETNEVGVNLESRANSEKPSEFKLNDNFEGNETKNSDNDLKNNENIVAKNVDNVGNGVLPDTDADSDINDMEVASFERQQRSSMKEKDNLIEIGKEAQDLKKQKKSDVIGELEEHLERKKNPKRSKRAFGPLTPSSERPLVLPGGRRWYRPKDAYNDEFIAETLSAQAELITGSTLGCTYESPLLGYDPRVNFMKYQKPERKIDLNRSEVYKIIHHLDRQPVRGIEVRAPVVPAEADIRKAVHS